MFLTPIGFQQQNTHFISEKSVEIYWLSTSTSRLKASFVVNTISTTSPVL